MRAILAIFMTMHCVAVAGERLKTQPLTFDVREKFVRGDPKDYSGRISKPSTIIDLFHHNQDKDTLISITAQKVDFTFETLCETLPELPVMIADTNPGAYDAAVRRIKINGRDFIECKFKTKHNARERSTLALSEEPFF